eukprot:TRINITY_DN9305_c0_g1_i3.p1 TRINITY_DN9305_c0_g1~~TRINITY_DN9305_c0_g1_i3.p1  ORF type:complete len:273 (+),score=84.00 TRINITY_DN9305_c0_g1_i3:57-875(+)
MPVCGYKEYDALWGNNNTPWGVTSAILGWCETCETDLFAAIDEHARKNGNAHMADAWDQTWHCSVRRAVKLFMLSDRLGPRVAIEVRLLKAGRTSVTLEYRVTNIEEGRLAAVAQAVIVAVDPETMAKPRALPYAEQARHYCLPASQYAVPPTPTRSAAPKQSYNTYVRKSDCDVNGHVNNAVYVSYGLDALPVPNVPMVGYLSIEYMRQVPPGKTLHIDCWTCEEVALEGAPERIACYECEYTCDGEAAARAVICALPEVHRRPHKNPHKL